MSGLEGSLAPPCKGWSVNILPVRSTAFVAVENLLTEQSHYPNLSSWLFGLQMPHTIRAEAPYGVWVPSVRLLRPSTIFEAAPLTARDKSDVSVSPTW